MRRNATPHDGAYRGEKAQSYAVARRRRCRRGPQFSEDVLNQVESALRERWSPEQIVGQFGLKGRSVPSHETIYRRLRHDRRTGGTLYRFTWIMSKTDGSVIAAGPRGACSGQATHIGASGGRRPASRIGDWEGDTVMGTGSRHCLLTLVERKSGFTLIRKLEARTMAEATAAASSVIQRMRHRFQTITFDNGTEFHDYERLERRFGVTCYFATPYHSWERGSNENLNGLVRQYLPRGRSLKSTTQEDCDKIAAALNNRPANATAF
ncbi:MAG: IS30 family transposase [Holophagales bacterium]|nr:IS30 family transposase [Holophagales bacterium]